MTKEKRRKVKYRKNKTHAIMFFCMFSMILLIALLLMNCAYKNKQEAVSYLSEKYGAFEQDFDLVKYYPKRIINNSSNTSNLFDFYLTNEKWRFKYKNRLFYVEKIKNKFYDNYQLEDISYWAKSYLKDNVDQNIMGIEISSEFLYDSTLPNLPTNTNESIDYKDTLNLLFDDEYGYRKTLNIYYFVDNQNDYRDQFGHGNKKYETLKKHIESELETNNDNIEINLMLFEAKMEFRRFDKKIQKGISCEVYGIPYDKIDKECAYY